MLCRAVMSYFVLSFAMYSVVLCFNMLFSVVFHELVFAILCYIEFVVYKYFVVSSAALCCLW